ncbi:GMC oxidoreductase [Erythrobacter rubeus]|uniref:GMC family oxidoreductase n=1 Tax=Erythrobacter rubeus TaxID=2760803 RepID=A0ABR8KRW5_9SPHN|nr:GMC family oxidoreductase [Erythrobacter rubeus]MBD2840987.1 GMC family oxidoreductase [Erythrobacter rubeus]
MEISVVRASAVESHHWDVIVIGSGFGSLFFLQNYLKRNPNQRILVLEWGAHHTQRWQIDQQKNSAIDHNATIENESKKDWNFSIGLGGGTNCWQGMAARMHPHDFELQSRYGVGFDWPISYDDIADYYTAAEALMEVAGASDAGRVFPGSASFPQAPHHLSTTERLIKKDRPDTFFAAPQAKLTQGKNGRGACCNNGTCSFCPTGARFYAVEGMRDLWEAPNLSICTGARVRLIEATGANAEAVVFESEGRDFRVKGDLIVLGANGIHSPFILQQSGILDGGPGKYLGEKMLAFVEIMLDGIDHFDGGTATTGFELSYIDGPHRSEHGAVQYWTNNSFLWGGLRLDPPNRYREVLPIGITVEDLLYEENAVVDEGGDIPVVRHGGFSDYAHKGLDFATSKIPEVFSSLPIESVELRRILPTTDHIQGSLRMGSDPAISVVDKRQIHQRLRNLVVVGTAVFPTTSWAVPSLTCAAMSLKLGNEI